MSSESISVPKPADTCAQISGLFVFFILSWPVIASCCVSGLQRCEQCLGSRSGISEAADQQTHREHGVSQLAGNRLQPVPPKDHCTLLHSSLYVAVVSCLNLWGILCRLRSTSIQIWGYRWTLAPPYGSSCCLPWQVSCCWLSSVCCSGR